MNLSLPQTNKEEINSDSEENHVIDGKKKQQQQLESHEKKKNTLNGPLENKNIGKRDEKISENPKWSNITRSHPR